MAESDDEFYSNIANVYEPHFYPFPNDSALEHVRTVRLEKTSAPVTAEAIVEQGLFTQLFGAN
ncbi:hypothetical protein LPJ54_004678, partial [Coemansia sp. RSA 1824]